LTAEVRECTGSKVALAQQRGFPAADVPALRASLMHLHDLSDLCAADAVCGPLADLQAAEEALRVDLAARGIDSEGIVLRMHKLHEFQRRVAVRRNG
jgi:hypothetical protein